MIVDFLKTHKKFFFYVACIAYFIYYSKTEGRFHDPYNRYIKEHGQSTIGEITGISLGKAGISIWVSYSVDKKEYDTREMHFPEQDPYYPNKKMIDRLVLCLKDSNCIGEKYIVKYLPERPENGAVCFDKPINDSRDKK